MDSDWVQCHSVSCIISCNYTTTKRRDTITPSDVTTIGTFLADCSSFSFLFWSDWLVPLVNNFQTTILAPTYINCGSLSHSMCIFFVSRRGNSGASCKYLFVRALACLLFFIAFGVFPYFGVVCGALAVVLGFCQFIYIRHPKNYCMNFIMRYI